jgi:hypothetical protein
MKQVVFAVFLIAMASLTGCLNEEDSPVDDKTDDSTSDTTEDNSDTDDELIDPMGQSGGYTPPENSNIRVDSGVIGGWVREEGVQDVWNFVYCEKQGYQNLGFGYTYCDIDGHDDYGPQVWVNKTGNTINIECIKSSSNNCRSWPSHEDVAGGHTAYIIFTSIEGLREMFYFDFEESHYSNESNVILHKYEVTLPFEPAYFEITDAGHYHAPNQFYRMSPFGDVNDYSHSELYYTSVTFRVF